jgi:hypothetical protein
MLPGRRRDGDHPGGKTGRFSRFILGLCLKICASWPSLSVRSEWRAAITGFTAAVDAAERIAAEGLPRAAEWDSQFKAAVEAAVADRTTMHNLAQSFEDFQATMNESYRLSLLLRLVKLRKG